MHSRAWIGIVVIGVIGVVIMGFMTKFAIDSNEGLRNMIRFKTAVAKEFEADGVQEVSLRKGTGGSRYELVLARRSPAGVSPEQMDRRVAEFFVENFPDKSAMSLELSYQTPGSFGCDAGKEYRREAFSLSGVRADLALRKLRARLEASLQKNTGCRLLAERREQGRLCVDLAASTADPAAMRRAAFQAEPTLRSFSRGRRYTCLQIRVFPASAPLHRDVPASAGGGPQFVEVCFDARGKETRGGTGSARPALNPGASGSAGAPRGAGASSAARAANAAGK